MQLRNTTKDLILYSMSENKYQCKVLAILPISMLHNQTAFYMVFFDFAIFTFFTSQLSE